MTWAFSKAGSAPASSKTSHVQAQKYCESLFESLDDISIRFESPQIASGSAAKCCHFMDAHTKAQGSKSSVSNNCANLISSSDVLVAPKALVETKTAERGHRVVVAA